MTRSPAAIREIGATAVRVALARELGEAPAQPLLGAPRRPPLPWSMPLATTLVSQAAE